MRLYEALAHTLREQGVDVVFGLMGDGNLYAMDSFQGETGGNFVSVAHEAAAVLAAYGYAVTTGKLGVASTTHGPALTNTVTGLVEAARAKVPLLLVLGDTPASDPQNLQNIDQRAVADSAGAGFVQVDEPASIVEATETAIRRAHAERRPILLNVPAEFMWAEVDPVTTTLVQQEIAAPADGDQLDDAAGVLASARRPIVLAGRGATDPRARAALVTLAHRIGAPLATTLKGRELFAGEPEDLGIFGGLSHELALETILASDCVISFGARLNKYTVADGSLLEGRALIQVDTDRGALGALASATAVVEGDAAEVADALVARLDAAEVPGTGFASAALIERLAADREARRLEAERLRATPDDSTGTVDMAVAMAKLEAGFPADRTFVLDAGRFAPISFKVFHVPHPTAYVHTLHFGSIGLGMSAAVGAGVGVPDRPLLLVCGDGGFMLGGLGEFNTAVRHGIDMVVAVFNDGAYGAEHVQLHAKGMDPRSSTFDWPELAPLATALGGRGYAIRSLADLDEALAELPARDRPVLLDIKIDPVAVAISTHGPAPAAVD